MCQTEPSGKIPQDKNHQNSSELIRTHQNVRQLYEQGCYILMTVWMIAQGAAGGNRISKYLFFVAYLKNIEF